MDAAISNDARIAESRKSDSNDENLEEASYHSFQDYDNEAIVTTIEEGSNSTNFSKMFNSQSYL